MCTSILKALQKPVNNYGLIHLAWNRAKTWSWNSLCSCSGADCRPQILARSKAEWKGRALLHGLPHWNSFPLPPHTFMFSDIFCMLCRPCWRPVRCVESCFRGGTCNRLTWFIVRAAAGSNLLHLVWKHQMSRSDQDWSRSEWSVFPLKSSAQTANVQKERGILESMNAAKEQTLQ